MSKELNKEEKEKIKKYTTDIEKEYKDKIGALYTVISSIRSLCTLIVHDDSISPDKFDEFLKEKCCDSSLFEFINYLRHIGAGYLNIRDFLYEWDREVFTKMSNEIVKEDK